MMKKGLESTWQVELITLDDFDSDKRTNAKSEEDVEIENRLVRLIALLHRAI